MSRFHRLFAEDGDKYTLYRPTYPEELYQRIFDWCPDTKDLAVDVATGTGQAASELSKRFDCVIATDVSREQIAKAPVIRNVRYDVATAENLVDDIGLKDGSADLITVAAALHWFNVPAFYKQCQHALKPDGVLAVWAYQPYFGFIDNPMATAALKELGEAFLDRYWASPIQLVREKYISVLPTEESFEQLEWFSWEVKMTRTVNSCIGYFKTLSAYKIFKKQNPDEEDPLEIFYDEAMEALGLTDPDQAFEVNTEMFGFIAKKPAQGD